MEVYGDWKINTISSTLLLLSLLHFTHDRLGRILEIQPFYIYIYIYYVLQYIHYTCVPTTCLFPPPPACLHNIYNIILCPYIHDRHHDNNNNSFIRYIIIIIYTGNTYYIIITIITIIIRTAVWKLFSNRNVTLRYNRLYCCYSSVCVCVWYTYGIKCGCKYNIIVTAAVSGSRPRLQ